MVNYYFVCVIKILKINQNAEFATTRNPKEFAPVKDYLKKQSRFKHLKDEDIEVIKKHRDLKWLRMRKNWLWDFKILSNLMIFNCIKPSLLQRWFLLCLYLTYFKGNIL
jgi:hypothetical protein